MDQKLNISLESSPALQTVIIREGKAPDVFQKKPLIIEGSLGSIIDWIRNHKDEVTPHSLIQFYNSKREIKYTDAPNEGFFVQVIESAKYSDILNKFGAINKETSFSPEDLAKHIRPFKSFFYSDFAELYNALRKFNAKISATIESTKEDSGSRRNLIEVTAQHNLPSSFDLNIPIYEGMLNYKFTIELIFTATNGGLVINLVSDDLYELDNQIWNEHVKSVTDYILCTPNNYPITVIHQ